MTSQHHWSRGAPRLNLALDPAPAGAGVEHIVLFIYLTTILLQAVAWLVQFCRVTSSYDNVTTHKEEKNKWKRKNKYTAQLATHTALQERIKIYYKTWENHPRHKTQQPRYVMAR